MRLALELSTVVFVFSLDNMRLVGNSWFQGCIELPDISAILMTYGL